MLTAVVCCEASLQLSKDESHRSIDLLSSNELTALSQLTDSKGVDFINSNGSGVEN